VGLAELEAVEGLAVRQELSITMSFTPEVVDQSC